MKQILVILSSLVFLTSFVPITHASEWYVSPDGTAGGSGSSSSPWDLQTAFNQPPSVQAGDTIWLRDGTYSGQFTSILTGTSGNPITVRQYPNERAIIDGGSVGTDNGTLTINGSYTYYWGFEVMSSDIDRISAQSGSAPTDLFTLTAVWSSAGVGNKFINMVVHDGRSAGFGYWTGATDGEIYGNLVYFTGWQGSDRNHGHGIYTQNNTTNKVLKDNFFFNGFANGLNIYGSGSSFLNNFTVEGNIVFNNGALGSVFNSYQDQLLLGGESGTIAQNPTILNNYIYVDNVKTDGRVAIGYNGGCNSPTISGNYFAFTAGTALALNCTNTLLENNFLYGTTSGFSTSNFPNNTYTSQRPADLRVTVRPNIYDSNRGNIVIFNWNSRPLIEVDPSSVLDTNQTYSVYDVQNFFGTPVTTGVYTGSPIIVPMTSTTVTQPVGIAAPAHTSSEFGAFVLIGGEINPTPTPIPTPSGSAATSVPDSETVTTGTNNSSTTGTTTTGSSVSPLALTVKLVQIATGQTTISVEKILVDGIKFMGTAPSNALVSVTLTDFRDKKIPGSTKVDASGIWTWLAPPNLKPGDYAATFLVQDKMGNIASTTLKFTINEDGFALITESVQETSGEFVETEGQQSLLNVFFDFLKEVFLFLYRKYLIRLRTWVDL